MSNSNFSNITSEEDMKIYKHEKTGYNYIIKQISNKNGSIIEKFVKVNNEKKPMKNGNKFIYLNKNTGEAINGNGKKYVVNNASRNLFKGSNGYVLEQSSNSFSLPPRKKNTGPQPGPQPGPPPGMMRINKGLPPGGFRSGKKPNKVQYGRMQFNAPPEHGSFINYTGPRINSNQPNTIFGPKQKPIGTGGIKTKKESII